MCDVCSAEGKNFEFSCGDESKLKVGRLYKIYVGRVASIKLCRLCDIELFHMGESRFLEGHIKFAQHLVANTKASFFD